MFDLLRALADCRKAWRTDFLRASETSRVLKLMQNWAAILGIEKIIPDGRGDEMLVTKSREKSYFPGDIF